MMINKQNTLIVLNLTITGAQIVLIKFIIVIAKSIKYIHQIGLIVI